MLKTFINLFLSTVFAGALFAFSYAQSGVTVTAVGATTSSVINVGQMVTPTMVGSTMASSTCAELMTTFNKLGSSGPEVAKLQIFLNKVNGANLNGLGYFGPVTAQEVRNFQYTYGIKPTGYQHVLTTKKINDLNCGKAQVLPRKVFVASNSHNSVSGVQTSSSVVSKVPSVPAVVRTNTSNLVKEYEAPKTVKLVGTTTNATVTMATKTSFWENLSKDWNKIKENYKAYLLVFALVLALFWFLRKAATE